MFGARIASPMSETNQRQEDSPVSFPQIPVQTKPIRCYDRPGIQVQHTEIAPQIELANRQNGRKFENSLLFSLLSGNARSVADRATLRHDDAGRRAPPPGSSSKTAKATAPAPRPRHRHPR